MTNYSKDPELIRKAAQSGIITGADYQRYLEITKKSDLFKKGVEDGAITKSQYHSVISSVPQFYFEKSMESGSLRFKLHVEEQEQKVNIKIPVRRETTAVVTKSNTAPLPKNLDELKKARETGDIGMATYHLYLPLFTAVDKITRLADSITKGKK